MRQRILPEIGKQQNLIFHKAYFQDWKTLNHWWKLLDQNKEGYLFLCTNRTQRECFQRKLFGLSRKYWGWVEQIDLGTPLFLFNMNSKILFGPFRAASKGKLNINPTAWENARPNSFPAQVAVDWKTVHEVKAAHRKFDFLRKKGLCKLTKTQTAELIAALEEASLYESSFM